MFLLVHLELVALLAVGAVDDATVSPDGGVGGAGSGSAGVLLSIGLLVASVDFASVEGLGRGDSSVGEVDADGSLDDIFIDLGAEEFFGEGDLANLLALVVQDRQVEGVLCFVSHVSFSLARLMNFLIGRLLLLASLFLLDFHLGQGFGVLSLDVGDGFLAVVDDGTNRELLAGSLDGGADLQDSKLRSGDGAADEDAVEFRVDLDDRKVKDGGRLRAPLSGHHLAGVDPVVAAAVGGQGADLSVIAGTMGLGTDVGVISLDDAAIAMSLALGSDIDHVSDLEDRAVDGLANFVVGVDLIAFDLADNVLRSGIGLLGDSEFALVGPALLLVLIADLQGFIAVLLLGLLLENDVRQDFDDGNRVSVTVLGEDGSHSDLSSDDGFHKSSLLLCLEFDFNIDAGRKIEVLENVDGLLGRAVDVDQSLVSADFELLTRVLVDEG